jgi:RNA polymerase sigma factor (sigma-70 family)
LVYGTARRQVGNPHVAEEICHKVFCTLAQNAQSIRHPEQLSGWLYHTTRQLAAMHFRSEERRTRRERLAAENTEAMDQTESWNEIEPLLDQAMDSLAEMDRLAILLRFFKGNSMTGVAAGLGVSEAAAKMRVGRALEKLRTFFSSCGIACSVAGLLALLDQNAAASVPPSVTASILSQVGKLKAAAKIPATVASAPKIGLQMAGAILVVGMAVTFLGPKLMRSNRASNQQW